MATKKSEEVIPSARRLITSLRDMGYDFAAAVADLVDNAIEADATVVNIDVEFDGDDSWVRIADNGKGMTYNALKEAMRYGTERDYDESALGKFGLGLKTASLSQCRKLSVVSRANIKVEDKNAYSWDLDHIEGTNRWEIVRPGKTAIKRIASNYLANTTGTVVFWQRLDRMLGLKYPYGEFARKRLLSMCRELEVHLSMVFHRFIAGEVSDKKLKIILNGNELEPWDPFARTEPKINLLTPTSLHVTYEDVEGDIVVEPYVLPHQLDFSSPEAFRRLSGPANWNQQQGFYIYRADRLIQSGGWSRLRTVDEHTKLARVALRFTPVLDDAFKINVSKMKVQFPAQVRDQIEEAIRPVIKMAQEVYRRNSSKPPVISPPPNHPTVQPATNKITPVSTPPGSSVIFYPAGTHMGVHTFSEKPMDDSLANSTDGGDSNMKSPKLWTLDALEDELVAIAKPDERPILKSLFLRFREQNM